MNGSSRELEADARSPNRPRGKAPWGLGLLVLVPVAAFVLGRGTAEMRSAGGGADCHVPTPR